MIEFLCAVINDSYGYSYGYHAYSVDTYGRVTSLQNVKTFSKCSASKTIDLFDQIVVSSQDAVPHVQAAKEWPKPQSKGEQKKACKKGFHL